MMSSSAIEVQGEVRPRSGTQKKMRVSRFLVLFLLALNCQASPPELRQGVDEFAAASLISIGPKPSTPGASGLAWRQASAKIDIIKRYAALIEAMWKQARRNKASGAVERVEEHRLDSLKYTRELTADVSAIEASLAQLEVESDQVKQLAAAVQETAKQYIALLEQKRFPEEAALAASAQSTLSPVLFAVGRQQFKPGDAIVIDQVLATSPRFESGNKVVVRGHYQLASAAKARLGLHVTHQRPAAVDATAPSQSASIQNPNGSFELSCDITYPGDLHVSFYPPSGGQSFGGVYFSSAPKR